MASIDANLDREALKTGGHVVQPETDVEDSSSVAADQSCTDVEESSSVAADNEVLTDQKAPSSWVTVMSVIFIRYAVEIVLGTATKSIYKSMCSSVPSVLLFEIVSFFPIILGFHYINHLGYSFVPSVFGGKWKFEMKVMKGYALAGIFLAGMLLLKQHLIKSTGGPGYAELLSCMSVPVGAIIQYFINNTKTGIFGITASVFCALTAIVAGVLCGPLAFLFGFLVATFNALRSSVVKKSSTKYDQAIGLNVLYAQFACFPIYLALLIYQEIQHVRSGAPTTAFIYDLPERIGGQFGKLETSSIFRWYWGYFPFYRVEYSVVVVMSLLSNILVMTIYKLCSPLSYLVSCQMKGILQIVVDLLYIDYIFVLGVNWIIMMFTGVASYYNALKYKNVNPIEVGTIFCICSKCTAAGFYVMEKINGRMKRKDETKI